MRLLASLEHYVALADADEVQRAPVRDRPLHGRPRRRRGQREVDHGLPVAGGQVGIIVTESADGLDAARPHPHWAAGAAARVERRTGSTATQPTAGGASTGSGRPGDDVVLDLPLTSAADRRRPPGRRRPRLRRDRARSARLLPRGGRPPRPAARRPVSSTHHRSPHPAAGRPGPSPASPSRSPRFRHRFGRQHCRVRPGGPIGWVELKPSTGSYG